MNQNKRRLAAFGMLVLILGVIGIFVIPAHTVSIWMDWEFTDWISPIANRLSGGARLYEDGLHSPMPPLPFVLVHLIWPQGAVWIDESVLYFLFQAGMILMLFWAFSKQFGVTTAFVCTLMVLPVYYSLPKTILYDAMAQFFVAACGITTMSLVQKRASTILLALELALLLLTKQNTFAGAAVGICSVLLFLPRDEVLRVRLIRLATTLALCGIFFCVIGLALNRWVSFSGLIRDVYVTGSEPKGGSGLLLKRLMYFATRGGMIVAGWGCVLVVAYQIARRFCPTLDYRRLIEGCVSRRRGEGERGKFFAVSAVTLVISVMAFAVVFRYADLQTDPRGIAWMRRCGRLTLNLGLTLACFFAGCVVFRKLAPKDRDWGSEPLVACSVVFLFSAVFHTLSVGMFRWSYDNNPFVFSALAFVLCGCIGVCENPALPKIFGTLWLRVAGAGMFLMFFWATAGMQIPFVSNCVDSWPEVKQLAHARLRPNASGMRELVKTVRANSDPARRETVLLLPNDPNVEAWFERDRPGLSCAIVFADQYWDRYVDGDLTRLKAQPPKVIVIGPRNYWREFSSQWKVKLGAERLIEGVEKELVAKDYQLVSEQAIAHRAGRDVMDIYVRRSK